MYPIIIIILSLLWMVHEELLVIKGIWGESTVLNFAVQLFLDYSRKFSGGNVTDDQHELFLTGEDELDSGLEHMNSTDSPLNDEIFSDFYTSPDGIIRFYNYSGRAIPLSPYYYCNESTPLKDSRSISIKCPCENVTYFNQCCPQGYMLFEKEEGIHWFSECTLKTEGTVNEYLPEDHVPYIIIYNAEKSQDMFHENYFILKDTGESFNITYEGFKLESMNLEMKYICDIQDIVINNSRQYQEITCEDEACDLPYDLWEEFLLGMSYLSIIFYGLTIIAFLLIHELRTMQSNILFCQSISFIFLYHEIIRTIEHSCNMEAVELWIGGLLYQYFTFSGDTWINVMSFDLALKFSDRWIFQRKKRKLFRLYSMYGWGCPVIIFLVIHTVKNTIGPLHGQTSDWAYHFGPLLFLTVVNWPLLLYAVYKISKGICDSRVLHKEGSGLHIGRNVKKQNMKWLKIYFNLALLIGCPRGLRFLNLIITNEIIRLMFTSTSALRAFFIFLFVCCKPKVFIMLKKKMCSRISGETGRSKTSDPVNCENICTHL